MTNARTTTREQAIEAIISFFEDNEELFNDCIEELDSYNGYLADDRYHCMDELNEFYCGTDPMDILYQAFYGYDEDSWHTDSSGNKIYGEFNPNRDYFRYNGYGNLVSADYKDYSDHLDYYAIDSMEKYRTDIYTIDDDDDLRELFDALEEAQSGTDKRGVA